MVQININHNFKQMLYTVALTNECINERSIIF